MKTKYKRNSSRRKTPWDNQITLTPMQEFIKDRYQEEYDNKHPDISNSKEIILLLLTLVDYVILKIFKNMDILKQEFNDIFVMTASIRSLLLLTQFLITVKYQ